MGRARREGLTADYRGASPEDVARALHAHQPQRERSHEERVARLLERRVVRPDELDAFSADEVKAADYFLEVSDNKR